jgi:hypothetical protein
MVAGPDFTLKATDKPLLAVGAATANEELPKVLLVMLAKVPIVWVPLETEKVVVTSGAAL